MHLLVASGGGDFALVGFAALWWVVGRLAFNWCLSGRRRERQAKVLLVFEVMSSATLSACIDR
jgi:hypothetical protein